MSHLKHESVNKCISLLREYIDEGPGGSKKETAELALSQLQKITAGTGSQLVEPGCHGRPMAG
jgi:hypothetical protein